MAIAVLRLDTTGGYLQQSTSEIVPAANRTSTELNNTNIISGADGTAGIATAVNTGNLISNSDFMRLVFNGGQPSDFSWANVTSVRVRAVVRIVSNADDTDNLSLYFHLCNSGFTATSGSRLSNACSIPFRTTGSTFTTINSSAFSVSGITIGTNVPAVEFDVDLTGQQMGPDGDYAEFDALEVELTYTPIVTPVWLHEDYRFYDDDAQIDSATALAAENTGITRTDSTRTILVVNLGETANATQDNQGAFTPQYRVNGGSWSNILAASGSVRWSASPNTTDGVGFTGKLSALTGAATYQSGWNEFRETDTGFNGSRVWTDDYAEFAICFQTVGLSASDVVEFRFLSPSTSSVVTSTNVPTLTIGTGGQTITCTGIASAEAHGSHTIANVAAQTVTVTGIASAEAHGSHTIANVAAQTISPTGLASAEAIGSHTLTQPFQTITVTGIASAEAIGSHTIEIAFQPITCTGIASAEAHGATTIANVAAQTISPAGIASAEAIGAATIANVAAQTISPTGIASAEAIGSHVVEELIEIIVTGIASAEAIGAAIITQPVQTITVTGISSAEAHGSHTIANVAAQSISTTGIASAEAIGSHTIAAAEQNITVGAGIDQSAVGSPSIANVGAQVWLTQDTDMAGYLPVVRNVLGDGANQPGGHRSAGRGTGTPTIYYVTQVDPDTFINTSDATHPAGASFAGSFRYVVNQVNTNGGPAIIVFETSGTQSFEGNDVAVTASNVSIFGQTAPPPGFQITNGSLIISGNQCVVQHIINRYGNGSVQDCISVGNHGSPTTLVDEVVIDHCTFGYSQDEGVEAVYKWDRLVVSHCLFHDGLWATDAESSKASFIDHGLLDTSRLTWVRNLMVTHQARHPMTLARYSYVANNYIYNMANTHGAAGVPDDFNAYGFIMQNINHAQIDAAYVNNVQRRGPDTDPATYTAAVRPIAIFSPALGTGSELWVSGNYAQSYNGSWVQTDPDDAPTTQFSQMVIYGAEFVTEATQIPYEPLGVVIHLADNVLDALRPSVGARPGQRDEIAAAAINEAYSNWTTGNPPTSVGTGGGSRSTTGTMIVPEYPETTWPDLGEDSMYTQITAITSPWSVAGSGYNNFEEWLFGIEDAVLDVPLVVTLTGIASAEAIGSHTVGQAFQQITVTGITSAEAVGSHTITQPVQSITLTGIASAEAHGSHTITQPFQTITLTGIASAEAIGSHTAANVAAQTISPTGLASAEAIGSHTVGQAVQNITLLNGIDSANLFGTATIANATPQTISSASLVNSQVFGSTTISHNSAQSISVTGIASAESVSNATVAHASPQTVTVTGIASVEQVGSHTVTGGGAPTWIGGWWVNGQQVDISGPIGTIFLDDITSVPGTAHFHRGIAFDPNGKRYICSWPGSGTVFYHNGIAHRSDGAMCVVQSSPDYYVGGFGVSYRGELCVALLTSDLYNAGIGITVAGRTGVSAL